jgi:hypothetical protein
MSKYDHSDRLSLLRLTEELEADQEISEKFDPERTIDERFGKAALKILEAEDPDSTHTRASAISAVLKHWIINGDLPIYHHSVRVADPLALLSTPHELTKESSLILSQGYEPEFHDIGPDMKAFEEEIFIRKEDFNAVCKRKNLPLPSFWFANEAEIDVAQNADESQKKHSHGAGQSPHLELPETDALAQIRQLPNPTADEVSLTLLADNMIKVEARGKIARVHYAALELINRHTGKVNFFRRNFRSAHRAGTRTYRQRACKKDLGAEKEINKAPWLKV